MAVFISVSPSLRLSVSPSLRLSISPSLLLSVFLHNKTTLIKFYKLLFYSTNSETIPVDKLVTYMNDHQVNRSVLFKKYQFYFLQNDPFHFISLTLSLPPMYFIFLSRCLSSSLFNYLCLSLSLSISLTLSLSLSLIISLSLS